MRIRWKLGGNYIELGGMDLYEKIRYCSEKHFMWVAVLLSPLKIDNVEKYSKSVYLIVNLIHQDFSSIRLD